MSEMTVEEMAARLGLSRENDGAWRSSDREPRAYNIGGKWVSWPGDGDDVSNREEHPTEHAGMLRLYRLRFPEVAPEPAPAPVKRSNVEIVLAAYKAWQKTPNVTDDKDTNVRIDNAT